MEISELRIYSRREVIEEDAVFRDFIYLDTDRVQSIIAQLQHGLLSEVMEGNAEESSKSAKGTLNFLSMLLPFSASVSAEKKEATDIHKSKVLHDYAYNLAHGSLEDQGFLLQADHLSPADSSTLDDAFILVRGEAKIFDYATFKNLAEHEKKLDKLFSSEETSGNRDQRRNHNKSNKKSSHRSDSIFGDIKVLVDAFFADSIQVHITNTQDAGFVGPLTREYLREDIRDLIFKYGSKLQGEWTMLAQIGRVPTLPGIAAQQLEETIGESEEASQEEIETASSALNQVLEVMNALQGVVGSAAYPDFSISPIAIYREVQPL